MNRWLGIGMMCFALSAAVAQAAPPNYNYTELSYLTGQFEQTRSPRASWHQDGFQVSGSYAIDNRFWLAASYADVEGDKQDNAPVELRSKNTLLRAGYIFYPAAAISLDVSAQWRFDTQLSPIADADGPGLAAGIRANIAMFELFARGAYLGGDFDDGYSLNAGAIWHMSNYFSLTGGYAVTRYKSEPLSSDYDSGYANIGVRFSFPNN
jgi:hypothetical protein